MRRRRSRGSRTDLVWPLVTSAAPSTCLMRGTCVLQCVTSVCYSVLHSVLHSVLQGVASVCCKCVLHRVLLYVTM